MVLELDLRKVQVYDTYQEAERIVRPYSEANWTTWKKLWGKDKSQTELFCFYELRTGNDISNSTLLCGKYFTRGGEIHIKDFRNNVLLADCSGDAIKKVARKIPEQLNLEQKQWSVVLKPFVYTVVEETSNTMEDEEITLIKDLEKEMGVEEWESMERQVGQRGKKLFQALASGETKSIERGLNLEERTLFEKYFFI